MAYLIAGLLGTLLGGLIATAITLLLLQRLADRDLVERRVRALVNFHEILGAPSELAPGGRGTLAPPELEQLVHNLESLGKEIRLTGWIFSEPLREELAQALLVFEEEARRARSRGEKPSVMKVIDAYRQFELTLRQAARREVRSFQRWRAWPLAQRREADSGERREVEDAAPVSRREN